MKREDWMFTVGVCVGVAGTCLLYSLAFYFGI